MKERPILFTPDMAAKVFRNLKTMTRRLIKPQPLDVDEVWPDSSSCITFDDLLSYVAHGQGYDYCPHGMPGDRLWVKETWRPLSWDDDFTLCLIQYPDKHVAQMKIPSDPRWPKWFHSYLLRHAKMGDKSYEYVRKNFKLVEDDVPWRSSLFMPRWVSRSLLEITELKLEELQSISQTEAIKEGCQGRRSFALLWDSIHKSKHRWHDNPWVWGLVFSKL